MGTEKNQEKKDEASRGEVVVVKKITNKNTPVKPKSRSIAKPKTLKSGQVSKKAIRRHAARHITIKEAELIEYGKKDMAPQQTESEPTANKTSSQKKKTKKMKLPTVRKLHFKFRYVALGVVALLIAVFFGRVAIWEHNYLATMEGSERDVTVEEIYSNDDDTTEEQEEDVVTTEEPTATEIYQYRVPDDKPRYLTIRSLGIYNARIVEVGLTSAGAIGTPSNIYNVGWYTGSSLPGKGVAVFDAHGGDLGNGIFKYLPRISIGDEIVIEMGDELTKYTYVVTDTVRLSAADANSYMPTAFKSPQSGRPSITLITCTGEWLQTSQSYSQRFFVRAVLK